MTTRRIIVEISPDGSAAAFPEPADGLRAAVIDRDSIEAEMLRRLATRVLAVTHAIGPLCGQITRGDDTIPDRSRYADVTCPRCLTIMQGLGVKV